ncbi:MAG: hypothetical protein ACRDVE_14475 [Actinocrinis sp.]
MTVRDNREAAYWDHWRAGLRDNPRDALPAFLDALEAIDRKHDMVNGVSRPNPSLVITTPPATPQAPAATPRRRTTRKDGE